ncbi:adenylate/guanylate cyclase domain-containing protein [Tundrisphaera sp. TA3]|uniref:adenylate/guanylate cyclase domain-containing protein n=1 Tax=Tundrisphaera sp. TA3 TaxID=3435775 RepID=UPI003EB93AC7
MNATFRVRVVNEDQQVVFVNDFSKAVEIGRQDRGEPGPYSHRFENGRWRLVIAPLTEDTVSRRHLSLEPLPDGRMRVRNGSRAIPIRTLSGQEILSGETVDLAIPLQLMIGRKTVRVVAPEPSTGVGLIQELPEATLPPGAMSSGAMPPSLGSSFAGLDGAGMVRGLRVAMDVLQAAATTSEFFDKAAQATLELVGLDSASVLRLRDGAWAVEAFRAAPNNAKAAESRPNRHVLRMVLERKKTLWEVPTADASVGVTASIDSLAAVVASPILNREGDVIGALYGDRSYLNPISLSRGNITEVQAMLIELIASGIAAGLERLKQEKAAMAARVQFEQFFTPDLARHLEMNPDLLKGRECEVTVLFCDIRGFSRISARLGPARTVEWINDVMATLSDSVAEHHGVLVDYIGDELMAMWGAPQAQPDHARLACRAALDMLGKLDPLVRKWEPILGEPFDLGIGLNTGPAQVGNTGSPRKFKYGPLGNTVNLASRVQGATKHFHTRLIVTGETHAKLDAGFATRRLGRVRVVNIAEPVELYEVVPGDDPRHADLRAAHEKALAHYENRDLRASARLLGNLQVENPTDGPSLILLSRVVSALCDGDSFDPVWTLSSK